MRRIGLAAVLSALVACGGDATSTGSGCPGVGGFGSYGCSRIVVNLVAPAPPHPSSYALDLLVRDPASGGAMASTSPTGFTATLLTVWFYDAAIEGDTLRAWVVARMFNNTQPTSPVFAADSVRRLFRISHNGTLPVPDTITLTLKQ